MHAEGADPGASGAAGSGSPHRMALAVRCQPLPWLPRWPRERQTRPEGSPAAALAKPALPGLPGLLPAARQASQPGCFRLRVCAPAPGARVGGPPLDVLLVQRAAAVDVAQLQLHLDVRLKQLVLRGQRGREQAGWGEAVCSGVDRRAAEELQRGGQSKVRMEATPSGGGGERAACTAVHRQETQPRPAAAKRQCAPGTDAGCGRRTGTHLWAHADGHAQDLARRVQPQLPDLKLCSHDPNLHRGAHGTRIADAAEREMLVQ